MDILNEIIKKLAEKNRTIHVATMQTQGAVHFWKCFEFWAIHFVMLKLKFELYFSLIIIVYPHHGKYAFQDGSRYINTYLFIK